MFFLHSEVRISCDPSLIGSIYIVKGYMLAKRTEWRTLDKWESICQGWLAAITNNSSHGGLT